MTQYTATMLTIDGEIIAQFPIEATVDGRAPAAMQLLGEVPQVVSMYGDDQELYIDFLDTPIGECVSI